MERKNQLLVSAVLLVFTLFTIVRHFGLPGRDLSSSYYSCRLLAADQTLHVYSRDSFAYDDVSDPAWSDLAGKTDYPPGEHLHPFVQTPLWPYILEPMCTRMNYPLFNQIFLCLISIALSGCIWLIARHWAPRTFHPGWIALICACLYISDAYKNALYLTQTHVLFIFLTLAALLLARGKYAILAGCLLAAAATVKITPIFLVLYWLVVGKRRAAVSCIVFVGLFAAVSILATGWALNVTYIRNLAQISNILLVSKNNQSLAALWMGTHYPYSETQAWHAFLLPPVVKWTSTILSIVSVLVGGLLDRKAARAGVALSVPYGAAFAMLGLTMFANVAWNHYYILLIFPMMLMLNAALQRRHIALSVLMIAVVLLNFQTQTMPGLIQHLRLFPVMRAEFFSGLLCMVGLTFLSLQDRRQLVLAPSEVEEVAIHTDNLSTHSR